MGNDWEAPRWQREGRTGPNGPRYARLADRNAVRAGKPVPADKSCGLALLAFLSLPVAFTIATGIYFGVF